MTHGFAMWMNRRWYLWVTLAMGIVCIGAGSAAFNAFPVLSAALLLAGVGVLMTDEYLWYRERANFA